ncbi:hypothetical protein [Anoxybacillus sp. TBDG-1]
MLQTMLSPEVMTKAAERLMKLLPYKKHSDVIKRAWQLYRTGHVYNVTIENNVLKGKVTDRGHTYEPSFQLKQISSSLCGCTSVGICAHNLALFLYAYNQIDTVGDFIRRWKEPNKKQKKEQKEAAISDQSAQKKESLSTKQQPKEAIERKGSIVESWWQSFEKKYDKMFRHGFLAPEEHVRKLIYSFFQTFERPTSKAAFLDHLYYFHGSLFTFTKLIYIPEQQSGYFSIIQERQMKQFAEKVHEAIQTLAKKPRTKGHEAILRETIPYVRHILFCERSYMECATDVYKDIWGRLLTGQFDRETECTWVMEQINVQKEPSKRTPFIIASSYLAFLLENDERAYRLIEPFPYLAVDYMIEFMEMSFAKKNIQRGATWFKRLESNIDTYFNSIDFRHRNWFTEAILFAYHRYSTATGNQQHEKYEQLLQKLLPYSFYTYIDYLFDKQKWKELIELYMFEKANVDMIHPFHVKAVEQADRSLVLPLYHQTIMHYIEQKNRSAYEQAMKHLRKLRAHYRALKQMPRWEAYIAKLTEQTKRLRAFQDLLRKGKFI